MQVQFQAVSSKEDDKVSAKVFVAYDRKTSIYTGQGGDEGCTEYSQTTAAMVVLTGELENPGDIIYTENFNISPQFAEALQREGLIVLAHAESNCTGLLPELNDVQILSDQHNKATQASTMKAF